MRRIRKVVKSDRGIYEPKLSEEDVVGQIRSFLEAHGAYVVRIVERVPKCYRCGCWLGASEGGIPDLAGWFPPNTVANPRGNAVHFFIECKEPGGGRKREKQKAFIDRARRDSVIAFFAPSLKDVRQILEWEGLKLATI